MGLGDDATGGRRPGPAVRLRPAVVVPALLLVLVVMALVGARLDRAPTDAAYRPALPPPPLTGRCNPLPDRLDLAGDLGLAFQLRRDHLVELPGGAQVRRLELHYDLADADDVRGSVAAALRRAGFTDAPPPPGAGPDAAGESSWFGRADYGRLALAVRPFDVPADSIVRGELVLDLPPRTLTAAELEACGDPERTKRWSSSEPAAAVP